MTGATRDPLPDWPDAGAPLRPQTREQLGRYIAQARERKVSIGPPGAAHGWDLSELHEVVSFHPPDMILSVEPGLTLDAIKDAAEKEHLWLPLDAPHGGNVSLAQYLAGDDSISWLSHHHGASRDWVMRVTACDDRGREVSSGARVVKNVAGYQLAPLYIGARDALGPLVEVTFRLLPLPARLTLAKWDADSHTSLITILQQARRQTHPSGRGEPWEALRIVRQGKHWRLEGVTRFPPETAASWGSPGNDDTISQVELPPREYRNSPFHPALRLQTLPTHVIPLLESLERLQTDLVCYPAAGVVTLADDGRHLDGPALQTLIAQVVAAGGKARVHSPESGIRVPAAADPERDILRRVKAALDPDGVFGPLPETL
ncbi:MAG: FAD-binding oxidoreductase [Candidatus Neomarinimicrobiota bacterium]